jgi:hypothetical protein
MNLHPSRSRPSRLAAPVVLALAGLLLSAGSCSQSDVGTPCNLEKTSNLGGTCEGQDPVAHPECWHPNLEDFRQDEAQGGKDYLSFGVAGCDNLTCVRTQGEALPSSDAAPDGYCSGECINDDDCQSDAGKFECRALVLDDDFLEGLRATLTPEEYEQYFGRIQTAKYCARRP